MSPSLQAKFLRILQDGALKRIGGSRRSGGRARRSPPPTRSPRKASRTARFREDLYYRLNVFTLSLPLLRARREDIPLLIQAFVEEFDAKYERKVRGRGRGGAALLVAPRLARQRAPAPQHDGARGHLLRGRAHHRGGPPQRAGRRSREEPPRRRGAAGGREAQGRGARGHPEDAGVGGQQQDARRRACSASVSRPFTTSSTATASSMRWGLKSKEAAGDHPADPGVVATTLVVHLAQLTRVAVEETQRQAELIAKQIVAQSARVLARAPDGGSARRRSAPNPSCATSSRPAWGTRPLCSTCWWPTLRAGDPPQPERQGGRAPQAASRRSPISAR